MPVTLKVTTNPNSLNQKLAALAKRYPRPATAAINRTAERGYTFTVREIQKDTGASSQKTIRRNLSVSKASSDNERPAAKIIGRSAKRHRIPIYELGPRPRGV